MIGLRVRHHLFDIGGMGKLRGQGTRVRPRTQHRGIQRDGDEHGAEEFENAVTAGLVPLTAHDAHSWFRLCDDALPERILQKPL
jgi:hypothetical protein